VDSETAKGVLFGITALAVIVWLAALQFLLSSARKGQRQDNPDPPGFSDAARSGDNILTGEAEVEGQASVLSARAASLLARGSLLPNVPMKIVEKSDSHIRFERVEPGGEGQTSGRWLRRGQLSFTSLGGGRSRVEWAAELANMQWLLRLGAIFQVAGLVAIVGGCWAILTYVVPSPDPAIRWQTVQMVQVCHFLWPPFLFGALHRRGRREVVARLEALVHNLPYLGDEA
jgi:hypothetical protein